MAAIVKVSELWKRYWIRHDEQSQFSSLREELAAWLRAPSAALKKAREAASQREEFWALKDVSFEVNQGDVIGIVGGNGAGKSTLLKVLSRITEPTRGHIEIEGRVASLLEVGTGFHQELTGRENIYLNGAILGMSRAEIRRKFDEIVAFAEVEKFLDTPVKRYSSGMYVRLAFAVAAHLEPEILVVDEVLAVGDAQFQKKCLGKMQDVSTKEGRTVFFVSHQMGTVRQLCTKGILLQGGTVAKVGTVSEVIEGYMNFQFGGKGATFEAESGAKTDIAVLKAWTCNQRQEAASYFVHDEPIVVRVSCVVNRWIENAELRLYVDDVRGRRVFTSDIALMQTPQTPGFLQADARIPAVFLRPGTYVVSFCTLVHNRFVIDPVTTGFSFIVQDGGSKYAGSEGADYGCIFSPCEWTVQSLETEATEARAALAAP